MVHILLLAIVLKIIPKIFNDNDIEKKNEYLNCYISSIKKTDDFIKKVYETLKENEQKTHRTFSMIYFSDHGLCHQERW